MHQRAITLMSSSRSSTASERPNPVNVAGPRAACGRSGKPGDYIFTLRHNGLERRYRVHVPANYDATRPAAVLVALHGGGNMEYQANDVRYGLISKSDSAGFIAVFPNGTRRMKRGMFATWNAGNCCAHARDASVDDVGFVRKVVEDVSRQWDVDRGRIYATGMSNGGLMAYRLACEASDLFTAIAAVRSPIRGTCPRSPILRRCRRRSRSGQVSRVARRSRSECSTCPARIAICTRRVAATPGCSCATSESGGHSWPGGTKPRASEPPSTAISAGDVMWAFFNP